MRREDAPTGEALNGIPVPIMENSFLVGLSRGNAEGGQSRSLAVARMGRRADGLGNGNIAKLTFEKGRAGQRAIDDALAAWQAQ